MAERSRLFFEELHLVFSCCRLFVSQMIHTTFHCCKQIVDITIMRCRIESWTVESQPKMRENSSHCISTTSSTRHFPAIIPLLICNDRIKDKIETHPMIFHYQHNDFVLLPKFRPLNAFIITTSFSSDSFFTFSISIFSSSIVY